MPTRLPLVALLFALGGTLFSGYLSYLNLFGNGCSEGFVSCGGDKAVLIFGQESCIYGFFMFLLAGVLIAIAWPKPKLSLVNLIFGLSVFGSLFAASLTVYEYTYKQFTGLSACVVGLAFYLGVTMAVWAWRRKLHTANLPMVTTPNQPPAATP